jgi:hypothetical protein
MSSHLRDDSPPHRTACQWRAAAHRRARRLLVPRGAQGPHCGMGRATGGARRHYAARPCRLACSDDQVLLLPSAFALEELAIDLVRTRILQTRAAYRADGKAVPVRNRKALIIRPDHTLARSELARRTAKSACGRRSTNRSLLLIASPLISWQSDADRLARSSVPPCPEPCSFRCGARTADRGCRAGA